MTEDHGQFISVLRLLKNVWERFGSQASFLQEIDASLGVILFRTTDWDLLRLHQDCVMHSVGLSGNYLSILFQDVPCMKRVMFHGIPWISLGSSSGAPAGMHVFWTWAPFFWTCTCFLDLTRIFFGPRVTKNVGDLPVCFLNPVGIFFVDLHVFVLDPRIFFFRQPN